MLLLQERERRLRMRKHVQPDAVNDVLVVESDALIEDAVLLEKRVETPGALALYRPLAHLSLARMPWSGAVDHGALQDAIVCSPPRDAATESSAGWLYAVTTLALDRVPRDEPALHVSLGADDVAVLSRVGTRLAREGALGLVRAAALPTSIVGTDADTVSLAGTMLAGYRHAALVFAWQTALCGNAAPDIARERDAAAVQLLSMLRALLGEV